MPRAGRPVKTLVIAVCVRRVAAERRGVDRAGRWLRRRAGTPCRPAPPTAPSASAAFTPAASAMPPAAITGTDDGPDDLRHQRERAHLPRQIVRQEDAAMAARLDALRDDRVDAARLQPARLLDRRRRRHDTSARTPSPRAASHRLAGRSGSSRPPACKSTTTRAAAASNGARPPVGGSEVGVMPSSA